MPPKLLIKTTLFAGFLAALALAPPPLAAADRSDDPRPNIILINTDDIGYGMLGSYGQQHMQTPRLDQMAAEGLRFTRFYAGAPSCLPSRVAMMNGLHIGHARVRVNGISHGVHPPIHQEDICVSKVLQDSGYTTGMIGKWALGNQFLGNVNPTNNVDGSGAIYKHGWDFYIGEPNQSFNRSYYPDFQYRYDSGGMLGPATPVNQLVTFQLADDPETPEFLENYVTDLYTRTALDFIDANQEAPFFLYLPYTVIHSDHSVPALEPYTVDQPWPHGAKVMASMITRLDRDIGRILDRLDALGIAENTLVIFTSDNGAEATTAWWNHIFDNNGGLEGNKHRLTEGGLRVPTIAWWPGTIAPGRESHELFAFWDFMPTLSELAGITAPEPTDGISFVPTLLDRPGQRLHGYLYFHMVGAFHPSPGGHYIVRGATETRGDSEIIEAAYREETVVSVLDPRFTVTAPRELYGPEDPLPEAPSVIELHNDRPVFGLRIPDGVIASLQVSEDLETWHDPEGWLVLAGVTRTADGREERRFKLVEPLADRLYVRSTYTRYRAPMLVPENGVDPTPPTATGASQVSAGGNLLLFFDKTVRKGSGSIAIKRLDDGETVGTINVNSDAVTINGSVVTITPDLALVEGISYYVEMPSGVVEDLAGNPFAGFSGSSDWSFTVIEPPVFLAYHDFGATTGEESTGNITTHQSGPSNQANNPVDTTPKALIDFATGSATGVNLQLSQNNAQAFFVDTRTGVAAAPTAGTPAADLFDAPGLNFDGSVRVRGNSNDGGNMVITLTGLDPNLIYDLALYGDRTIASTLLSAFTLAGADAAVNSSSTGIQNATTTHLDTRSNHIPGHIIRWTGIDPGADGTITVTVTAGLTPSDSIAYLTAIRLEAAAP